MRSIKRIIVHCSATRPEWMEGQPLEAQMAEIRRWHVDSNGWDDIAYHYVIGRDGDMETGRPVEVQGAHTKGHNADSIGVCLVGGFGSSQSDAPSDHFTPAQMATLRRLVKRLAERHGATVHGHNEFSAKACPGFDVARWWADKPARTRAAQSTTIQASAGQIVSGAGAVLGGIGALDGVAQVVAIAGGLIVIALAAWIMRERLRKWAAGVR